VDFISRGFHEFNMHRFVQRRFKRNVLFSDGMRLPNRIIARVLIALLCD